MTKNKNKYYITGILIAVVFSGILVSAQYYDSYYSDYQNGNYSYNYGSTYDYNNYPGYSQPYGVTSFNGNDYNNYNSYGYLGQATYYNDPYYSNNNYNNNCYPNCNTNCYYTGCNNNYNSYQTFTPTTYAASNITSNSATINGYVVSSVSGGSYYNSTALAKFQYGTSYNSLNYSTGPASIYNSTSINSHLPNLTCNTRYYYRATTNGPNGVLYGSTLSFITAPCYNNYYSNYNPYNNGGYNNVYGNW